MAISNLMKWCGTRKRRLDEWRDGQSGYSYGCMTALILGFGLFSLALLFGGMMGDYIGGTSPAELAEHNRSMSLWFSTTWSGLLLSFFVGRWWLSRSLR